MHTRTYRLSLSLSLQERVSYLSAESFHSLAVFVAVVVNNRIIKKTSLDYLMAKHGYAGSLLYRCRRHFCAASHWLDQQASHGGLLERKISIGQMLTMQFYNGESILFSLCFMKMAELNTTC